MNTVKLALATGLTVLTLAAPAFAAGLAGNDRSGLCIPSSGVNCNYAGRAHVQDFGGMQDDATILGLQDNVGRGKN